MDLFFSFKKKIVQKRLLHDKSNIFLTRKSFIFSKVISGILISTSYWFYDFDKKQYQDPIGGFCNPLRMGHKKSGEIGLELHFFQKYQVNFL